MQPTHVVSGSHRFRPADRVRQSRDYVRSRAEGTRISSQIFATETTPTTGTLRLGLVVSRRVGGAAQRNRVKRLVREWFRRNRARLPAHADFIVVARVPAATLDAQRVWESLDALAARAPR